MSSTYILILLLAFAAGFVAGRAASRWQDQRQKLRAALVRAVRAGRGHA